MYINCFPIGINKFCIECCEAVCETWKLQSFNARKFLLSYHPGKAADPLAWKIERKKERRMEAASSAPTNCFTFLAT